jgi:uncharacterized protein involved in exopolysaccharide biosynthesis/Mrp family chromosome partitioning ATPase
MISHHQHWPAGTGQGTQAPPAGVDLGRLLSGMWHRKRLVFGTVFLALAGTMALITFATPRYTSEALVLVEDGEAAAIRNPNEQRAAPPDSLAVQSEVEVLRSRDLAALVADKLELIGSAEFNPAAEGGSFFEPIMSLLGFSGDPGSAREKMFDKYYSKLSVYAVPNSRVIAIAFTSVEPKTAALVANTVATTYIDETQEAKFENTRRAAEWLSREIEKLRGRVADADAAVEQFRARSGLFEGSETTLERQELSELNTQITVAASARAEARSRADAIRDALNREGSVEGAQEVVNSQLIQRLREQQAALGRQIADLGQTYLPNHPRMKRLQAEMDGLDRQIRAEALKIAGGLEDQAKSEGAREQALRDKLQTLKTQAALTNQDEVRLDALKREAAANRTLLESFLAKYREATARADASALPPGARVISSAQVHSTPSFPRKGPMLVLALIGSLVVGTVLAFIAEMMSTTSGSAYVASVRHDSRVAVEPSVVGAPPPAPAPAADVGLPAAVMAEIPAASAPPRPKVARLLDARAGLHLRDQVRQLTARLATRRVLVTSVGGNGSKAAIVASLGRSLAIGRTRTLIIDADLGEPMGVARAFGMTGERGLSELLLGNASFAEVAIRDPISSAEVVAAGSSGAAAVHLLDSDRMDVILNALDQAYDLVIVNGPPATGQDLGKTVARRMSLALLVTDADRGSVDAANLAAHVLIAEGVREVLPVLVDGDGPRSEIHFGVLATGFGRAA